MKSDTRTTAGKIAVMQAFEDNKIVEFNDGMSDHPSNWVRVRFSDVLWRWSEGDYRIKQSFIEEAAERYRWSVPAEGCPLREAYGEAFVDGAKFILSLDKEKIDELKRDQGQ